MTETGNKKTTNSVQKDEGPETMHHWPKIRDRGLETMNKKTMY